jgi:RNA polymerase sigma-70 factor (ECF subfamily)
MQEKDIEILNQIRLKNVNAFEVFYKEYYKRLYILAYKYTRNQNHAEEIVHDIFLKIWSEGDGLNIQFSFGSYLSRCVINASLNWLKREKQEANMIADYGLNFEEIDIMNDDAEKLERQLILLEKALDLLPPQCKRVMMMSKFSRYKQQEIANTLNISVKTVKNHLTYGYHKIRTILADEKFLLGILLLYNFF